MKSWTVELDREWDVSQQKPSLRLLVILLVLTIHDQVLGPFPIHAREQHYFSPAFPLNRKDVFRSTFEILNSPSVRTYRF
jgi:hypothetical protein